MAKRKVLRDMVTVSGTTVVDILLHIPLGIIMARMLGPEGNGQYTYILVIPGIINMISRLGIRRSTIFYIGKNIHSVQDVVSSLLNIAFVTGFLGIFASLIAFTIKERSGISFPMIILATSTIPLSLLINYSVSVLIAKEKVFKFTLFQWVPSLLNLIFLIVLVIAFKYHVLGALMAYVGSILIMTVVAVSMIKREFGFSYTLNFKIIKDLILMGLSFSVAFILIRMHNRIDILILKHYHDFQEVGYYSLAAKMAERWQGPLSFGPLISAWVANAESEFRLKIMRLTRIVFFLGIIASIGLFFLVPYIIPLLYGSKFIPSILMVQIILPGITMLIIAKMLTSYFAGMGKPLHIILPSFFSLALNIALNFLLIPKYGGNGAALSSGITYSVIAIIFVVLYARDVNITFRQALFFNKRDFLAMHILLRLILRRFGLGFIARRLGGPPPKDGFDSIL